MAEKKVTYLCVVRLLLDSTTARIRRNFILPPFEPVMGRGGALSLTVMVVCPLPSPLHRCVVCPLPSPLHRCVDKAWGLLSS